MVLSANWTIWPMSAVELNECSPSICLASIVCFAFYFKFYRWNLWPLIAFSALYLKPSDTFLPVLAHSVCQFQLNAFFTCIANSYICSIFLRRYKSYPNLIAKRCCLFAIIFYLISNASCRNAYRKKKKLTSGAYISCTNRFTTFGYACYQVVRMLVIEKSRKRDKMRAHKSRQAEWVQSVK